VPQHNRVRLDDGDRIQNARPEPIEQHKQQPIHHPQVDALRRGAAQDDELMSKDEDLDVEPRSRLEQQEQRAQYSLDRLDPRSRALHDSVFRA
jgi:hypothetical protein